MAQYDGSIRINTKIDTKGFESGKKELEGNTKSATKSIDSSVKKLESEFEKLDKSILKTAQQITSLKLEAEKMRNFQIPTKEYTDAQKEVEKLEKALNNAYTRKEKFLETGGNESNRTFKGIEYDIEKLEGQLKYAEQDVKKLVDSGKAFTLGSDTEKFTNVSNQIEDLTEKMKSEQQRQTQIQSDLEEKKLEKIRLEEAEEQRLAQIRDNAVVSNEQIIQKVERIKQLEQEIADLKKVNRTEGYADYDSRIAELSKLKSEVSDYSKTLYKVPEKFEKMKSSAKKAFDAISSGTKKSSGLFSTFASRLKGIALSLLIFNWISKGFNAMISGMKQGFSNFAGYSDSYAQSIQNMKNAMSTLGNQFAAAFAPIIQMVIPWLNALINALTTAMTYVAQFIAVLGGKSTFTKAKKVQDDYNKSLGGTAKAADKARGALAKFDDLDVLEKQNDSGGGGGGGGDDSALDMFEEVPVDYALSAWLDDIIDKLNVLKGIFAKGFWDGLGDWGGRWESIKESISSIKNNLIDIWKDPAVLGAANSWVESTAYMLGTLAGATASIGLTIATNILGGISQYLEENKDRIKEHLITMFDIGTEVNGMFAELFDSIAYVFEAFASEQGQTLTANIIGIFTNSFMGIIELAGKFARDILNIFIQPFIENKEEFRTALEGFLTVLSEVAETIKHGVDETFSKLNEIYDAHFKPFFDSVANGLTELVNHFLTFWNEQVQPILEQWAQGFDTLWQEHIHPMINNFIELLGDAADFLKVIWETVIMPFIDWLIENILPVILPIIDGAVNALMAAAGGIADIISGIITVIRGIIEFLTGVFTGDWQKAWNGIVTIFSGVGDMIKGVINGILSSVEAMANGVVRAINKVIEALNGLSFDIPDWVPEFGGKSLGFNIKPIPQVSLPRLATGAVLRGGNPFMAILNDQPAGKTNIEAPLDTIKQAVREELSAGGYGRQESVPLTINLNYDGETFARVSISDILAELGRQGYDVSVLGVT